MDASARDFLESGKYLSFATRKRSGDWVATPVWFAPSGGAGKVKRLRNFSASRIAPCTFSGNLTGEWVDTQAYLLESEQDEATALAALRRKYGWQMYLGDFFSVLSGKMQRRAYIRIDL